MEQDSAKNMKGSMIMMSTMIWEHPKRTIWLARFSGGPPCLTLAEEELVETNLKKVRLFVLSN